jgi:acyl-coenzyme A synthetase/AMP-(fatty) acid ligase
MIDELRTTLAAYKVPKHVYVVASIGRDESGKINHSGLVRRLSQLTADQ